MKIEVLVMGCPKCTRFYENISTAVRELGINADIVKLKDVNKMTQYGAWATPSLVIDGKLISSGKVHSVEEIKKILSTRI